MSARFHSLASGSSGNAFLFSNGGTHVLIDCGVSARRLFSFLGQAGILSEQLSAIVLTHEHSDHVRGLQQVLRRASVPVYGTPGTLDQVERIAGPFDRRDVPAGGTIDFADCAVTSYQTPHDSVASCGYLMTDGAWTVCLATDIGWADPRLAAPLATADLLVLEANHDRDLLIQGGYPYHLKQRVAGDYGHLSNDQCAELLVRSYSGKTRDVWLAHLSKAHNSPELALGAVGAALERAGLPAQSLEVALRDRPSLRWSAEERGRQLGFEELLTTTAGDG